MKKLSAIVMVCGAFVADLLAGPVYNTANMPADVRKLLEATMVFKSATGQPKQLQNEDGSFGTAGLQAGQSVQVALVVPIATPGEPVDVLPLDGGKINIAPVGGKLAANGVVAFTFTPGAAYGLYRVAVARADVHYEIQFWHQDPNHPNLSRAIIPAN